MDVYRQNNHSPSRAWFLIPIVVVAAVLATVPFFFLRLVEPVGYPWYGWWFFPFPFFVIFPIIFLAFFGLRWIFWGGWRGRSWYYGTYDDPALQILKERFARGELSKDQFEQMAKDLEQH